MKNLVELLKMNQQELIQKYGIKNGAILIPSKKEGLRPLLTCHLDTINTHHYYKNLDDSDIVVDKNNIIKLSHKTKANCLGGDDRCGLYLVEELLKNPQNPYDVLITTDEEIGGIGIKKWCENNELLQNNNWSCIISLDRRSPKGENEFASYGFDNDELFMFLTDLGLKEGFGSYTDGVTLAEYTNLAMFNLSVGYDNEHKQNEVIYFDSLKETLKILQSKEFVKFVSNKKFEAEITYKDDWDYLVDMRYTDASPICCELCGDHSLLYEVGGLQLCEDCMNNLEY